MRPPSVVTLIDDTMFDVCDCVSVVAPPPRSAEDTASRSVMENESKVEACARVQHEKAGEVEEPSPCSVLYL